MVRLPVTLLLLHFTRHAVKAGTVQKGGDCSVASQRLNLGTYQFYTECDAVTFCNAMTSQCELKGCRKDMYPFGYVDDDDIPSLCPSGQFCPDEEDQCLDVLPVGSPCQFNRDDQCQTKKQYADTQGLGRNVNGAVCLNNVCMWANATTGEACTVQNTVFAVFGAGGRDYADIVSRDNCAIGSYCDAGSLVCMDAKNLGDSCTGNKECSSYNCLATGVCGESADTPSRISHWVSAVVAVAVFGGIACTLILLFLLHKKEREEARKKRLQYWEEQSAFRQSFLDMQKAAHASISYAGSRNQTSPCSRDSYYDDLQTPPAQGPSRPVSGLRYGTVYTDEVSEGQVDTPRCVEEKTSSSSHSGFN